jgi:hypothetical protein
MRGSAAVALAMGALLATAPVVDAYTYKVYNGSYASQQPDIYTCVAATTTVRFNQRGEVAP